MGSVDLDSMICHQGQGCSPYIPSPFFKNSLTGFFGC